jgi:hypothetical protein
VGHRWVNWAIGGVARPQPGEYAEVQLDPEGYAMQVNVRAFRPLVPCLN